MKRNDEEICDFINACPPSNYTPIANEILRNKTLSFKARGILCRMLSNSENWKSSIKGICSLGPEGYHSIVAGVKELEDSGYLCRVTYRDKKTKAIKGSFWMFTHRAFGFGFGINAAEAIMESRGMYFTYRTTKKPNTDNNHTQQKPEGDNLSIGNLKTGKPVIGYQGVSNIEYNKDLKNKDNIEKVSNTSSSDLDKIVKSQFELFWNRYPKKANKGKALSKWESICNKPIKQRPKWKEILKAIHAQKKSEQWQNPKFIPHAATWLNQNQWMNDPESMISYEGRDKGDQFGKGQGNNRSLSKIPIEYKEGRKV